MCHLAEWLLLCYSSLFFYSLHLKVKTFFSKIVLLLCFWTVTLFPLSWIKKWQHVFTRRCNFIYCSTTYITSNGLLILDHLQHKIRKNMISLTTFWIGYSFTGASNYSKTVSTKTKYHLCEGRIYCRTVGLDLISFSLVNLINCQLNLMLQLLVIYLCFSYHGMLCSCTGDTDWLLSVVWRS